MKYLALTLVMASASCRPRTAIVVFAASSVGELAEEAGAAWTKRTGTPVRVQTGSSALLSRQIREGAPCDVFLSADAEWVEMFRVMDRRDWLENRLALVVRRDAPDREPESLALGGEGVPAGKYARIALERSGMQVPSRVVYGASVRDVLSKVVAGAADAAIVYVTDAALAPEVRIARVFSEDAHPPIVYVAVLFTSGGRGYFEALRDPATLESAERRGFRRRP